MNMFLITTVNVLGGVKFAFDTSDLSDNRVEGYGKGNNMSYLPGLLSRAKDSSMLSLLL